MISKPCLALARLMIKHAVSSSSQNTMKGVQSVCLSKGQVAIFASNV